MPCVTNRLNLQFLDQSQQLVAVDNSRCPAWGRDDPAYACRLHTPRLPKGNEMWPRHQPKSQHPAHSSVALSWGGPRDPNPGFGSLQAAAAGVRRAQAKKHATMVVRPSGSHDRAGGGERGAARIASEDLSRDLYSAHCTFCSLSILAMVAILLRSFEAAAIIPWH